MATGTRPNGDFVIELPDLFENPEAVLGFTVNCLAQPPTADAPPNPGLCLITSSDFVYGPCPVSANPTDTDKVSKMSWGFGIGSDYLS